MPKRTIIVINGKEYSGIDDVPERLRPLLQTQIEAATQNPGKTITTEKEFKIPLDQLSPKEWGGFPPGRSGSGGDIRFDLNSSSFGALGWIIAAIAIACLLYLL